MEETTEGVTQRERGEGNYHRMNGRLQMARNSSKNGGIEEMLDRGIQRKQENRDYK